MKKFNPNKRRRYVRCGLLHRQHGYCSKRRKRSRSRNKSSRASDKTSDGQWIEEHIETCNINLTVRANKKVVIHLPKELNFGKDIELTCCYFNAIRKLARCRSATGAYYGLKTVDFSGLEKISTSAALVLTAELSKWNDHTNNKLVPRDSAWSQDIFDNFSELGFFDLFANKPLRKISKNSTSDRKLVRYIKAKQGDRNAAGGLSNELNKLVGKQIDKYTILLSGIGEAILNVSNHAYPEKNVLTPEKHRNWYLTGSFNPVTKQLNVVFFDQGIGIPAALPASGVWERVLKYIDNLGLSNTSDATRIEGAVQQGRTSTGEAGRGKGFPDMISYITERKQGKLKVYSKGGSYEFSFQNGVEKSQKRNITHSVDGTLIEWEVVLN